MDSHGGTRMQRDLSGYYFEELPVGTQYSTVGRTITEADVIAFCNCTGLTGEVFTNVEYQKNQSAMKGRPVPGAFAYCLCEGFGAQGPSRGTGMALLNVEINFENPIHIGDTIHAEVEVVESRPSKSRNDSGLVRFRNRIVKQDGTTAVTYTALRLIRRREKTT
jgi:acyl dehydratase